jgi:small-conductance mechanosensitive channel
MQIFGFEINTAWEQWAVSAGIFLLFIALAFAARLIISGVLRVLAHRTKTRLDDMVIRALTVPVFVALIVAGLWLALARLPELSAQLDIIRKIAAILFIAIAAIALVRVGNAFLAWYSTDIAPFTKTQIDDKLVPLVRRVGTAVVYVVALLIILDQLGVNISPLLAGLGIGGLAVALALQPTLSNFLAGTYVMSDAVVHVGDYVTLDSGHEGWVEDIGWRSTKLRHWQGNLIILPNSKLAEAIVTDYEKPDKSLLFTVDCGVSYDSDLDRVEWVAIAVAEEILQKCPEGAKDFKPVVRFKRFDDSNINFAVVLKSVDRTGHFVIKHEFIKALHKRFSQEGIEIQYPARKLYFADSRAVTPWQPASAPRLSDNPGKLQSDKKS